MKYLMPVLLLSNLVLCQVSSAAGWVGFLTCAYLLYFSAVSACGTLFSSARLHLAMIICFMGTAVSVMTLVTFRSLDVDLSYEPENIRTIEGTVIYDSSFTKNGNHMMKIRLSRCVTETGDAGTASGIVAAVGKERSIISAGLGIRLEGEFREGLFIYEDLQVLERSVLNDIREKLIVFLEERVLGKECDDASLMSCQLLLGRSENNSLELQEKARQCGCAHVFALSGMHLSIFAGICMTLFGKGKFARVMSCLAVAAFLLTAGPRPSLIRAALSFYLFFIPLKERTVAVYCIHMILFPATMCELGSCYGYLAVFAIVWMAPYLKAVLFQYIGRLSSLVSASLSVLVVSAPVYIICNGFWNPASVIAAPAAGFLAACSMSLGLLTLSFGRTDFLLKSNSFVYRCMDRLFDILMGIPTAGWVGYAVLVGVLLLLYAFNRHRHRHWKKISSDHATSTEPHNPL